MVTDLRLYSRVYGFFHPNTTLVYEPCVNIPCDVCKEIIPAYTYFSRKPLEGGSSSRKNPRVCKCRKCSPFKVSKNINRASFVRKENESTYVFDSYEEFQTHMSVDTMMKKRGDNEKEEQEKAGV